MKLETERKVSFSFLGLSFMSCVDNADEDRNLPGNYNGVVSSSFSFSTFVLEA